MGLLLQQDLVTCSAMHRKGHLIAHSARGKEERRFLTQQLGDHVLQEIDGGVFALLLVAHFCFRHGPAHGGGGTGHGIAVEIDPYHSIISMRCRAILSGTKVAVRQMPMISRPDAASSGRMSRS
jgi:hypothetical protein